MVAVSSLSLSVSALCFAMVLAFVANRADYNSCLSILAGCLSWLFGFASCFCFGAAVRFAFAGC